MELQDKFRGAIVGLACGDALGTTLEFKSPGSFEPLTDMVGGGPFNLKIGEWTDDTSMMLCLGTSLVHCKGFDANDQMERYVRWYREGYMSSNGRCFDIGTTVSAALKEFEETLEPFSSSDDPYTAGNGSLMRLAPVPLTYMKEPAKALKYARLSSLTTHGALVAVDACRLLTALIIGALNNTSKNDLLAKPYEPLQDYWTKNPLCPEIAKIASGSFRNNQPPKIKGTGYAADSLEAALWALNKSNSFEEGCLLAANLGDDADTTAAILGQVAGAIYGINGIPERWEAVIAKKEDLMSLADALLTLSATQLE